MELVATIPQTLLSLPFATTAFVLPFIPTPPYQSSVISASYTFLFLPILPPPISTARHLVLLVCYKPWNSLIHKEILTSQNHSSIIVAQIIRKDLNVSPALTNTNF